MSEKMIDTDERMHGQLADIHHDALRAMAYLQTGLIPAYELTVDQLQLSTLAASLERRSAPRGPSLLEIEL